MNNEREQQQSQGQATAGQSQQQPQGASFSGKFDSRYSEDPHLITDRLRSLGSNVDTMVVIGQKADGTAFAWSSGDEQRTQELAKQAAPVLAGLNT